jgi:hypothetical protein
MCVSKRLTLKGEAPWSSGEHRGLTMSHGSWTWVRSLCSPKQYQMDKYHLDSEDLLLKVIAETLQTLSCENNKDSQKGLVTF